MRRRRLPVPVAVNILAKCIDPFRTNELPALSSDVWARLSDLSNNTWTAYCWYVNVINNRQNLLGLARQQAGIDLPVPDRKEPVRGRLRSDMPTQKTERSKSFSKLTRKKPIQTYASLAIPNCKSSVRNPSDSDSSSDYYHDDTEYELFKVPRLKPGQIALKLILTSENWDRIKPYPSFIDRKGESKLRPFVWTNVIAEEFFKQFKLPCAFAFRGGRISNSSFSKKCYLRIFGRCISKTCNNSFFGYLFKKPPDAATEITIHIITRDTTTNLQHEMVKRPLNGLRRKQLAEECIRASYASVSEKLAADYAYQSADSNNKNPVGPLIPSLNTIRRAKHEHSRIGSNSSVANKREKTDPLFALYQLQFSNTEFAASIHHLSLYPFFVFYATADQMRFYEKYSDENDNDVINVSISSGTRKVDSVIFDFAQSTQNDSVLFCCIIIHSKKQQTITPIYQMLARIPDVETICLWLSTWLTKTRKRKKMPDQIILDYSLIVLCACSQAFNQVPLGRYIDNCCNDILENGRICSGFPQTYLKVDLLRLIHSVHRWRCLRDLNGLKTVVRDFYILSIIVLANCTDLKNFLHVFLLICTVAAQRYEDSDVIVDDCKSLVKVSEVREKLKDYISLLNINSSDYALLTTITETDSGQSTDKIELDIGNYASSQLIGNLVNGARTAMIEGQILNKFYVPEIVDKLEPLAQQFPLWSSVGMPDFVQQESSHIIKNYSEAYNINEYVPVVDDFEKYISIDAFVKIHLNHLLSKGQ